MVCTYLRQRDDTMKLRLYKDKFVYFTTKGNKYTFPCLSNVIGSIASNGLPEDNTVYMHQYSDFRDSRPDNILYFCSNAVFNISMLKNKRYTIRSGLLKFRTLYDSYSGYAIWNDSRPLEFYQITRGDRIAKEYFEQLCTDTELSNFILSFKDIITY